MKEHTEDATRLLDQSTPLALRLAVNFSRSSSYIQYMIGDTCIRATIVIPGQSSTPRLKMGACELWSALAPAVPCLDLTSSLSSVGGAVTGEIGERKEAGGFLCSPSDESVRVTLNRRIPERGKRNATLRW